jgi:hypothetical protein
VQVAAEGCANASAAGLGARAPGVYTVDRGRAGIARVGVAVVAGDIKATARPARDVAVNGVVAGAAGLVLVPVSIAHGSAALLVGAEVVAELSDPTTGLSAPPAGRPHGELAVLGACNAVAGSGRGGGGAELDAILLLSGDGVSLELGAGSDAIDGAGLSAAGMAHLGAHLLV